MSAGSFQNRFTPLRASEKGAFIMQVREMGTKYARSDLPWRNRDDAYAVLVSEVMLQQTQVSRVLKFWSRWMQHFPTLDALSSAATSDVLDAWQGLGYNRRALSLKRCADICSSDWCGVLPDTEEELIKLPGVGPATAAGVLAFAYQKPAIYIETNVRAVFIHHFFSHVTEPVKDAHIAFYVEQTLDRADPRRWYYALLDYGYYLKKEHANPARKAAAYTKQDAFAGSRRQKRAFIVREVLARPISVAELQALLDDTEIQAGRDPVSSEEFAAIVDQLASEGFFKLVDGKLVP